MGLNFITASSQYLLNNPSMLTAVPFTVGMWVRSTVTGVDNCVWSNSVDTTDYWELWQFADDTWVFQANDGAGDANCVGASVVSGVWTFFILRAISATNRRMAQLFATGSATHSQNTTSRTPAGVLQHNIGRSLPFLEYFQGQVAEFWYTNTDIQPGGAALDDGLLRQLAYQGPFSVPSIWPDIIEYRSFFSSVGSTTDKIDEVYYGKFGRQVWVNTGAARVGLHPALMTSYVRPTDAHKLLVI